MKCNYQFPTIPESGVIAYSEGNILRIFFDITAAASAPAELGASEEDVEVEADIPQTYDCIQVDVKGGRSYGDIVSAIVNDKYSNDDVQAIIANHTEATDTTSEIPEAKREEYLSEYSAYQQWRKHAKEIATTILEQLD